MRVRFFNFGLVLLTSLSFGASILLAQNKEKPYWVEHENIKNATNYYFGIGRSKKSSDAADDEARVAFSKNISVQVKSLTETVLSDSDEEIRDEYKKQTAVSSDLDLSGISITKRWFDEENKIHYSLIKYTRKQYNSIFIEKLRDEIELIKEKNINKEKQEREKLRHDKEQAVINAQEALAKIEQQKIEDQIEIKKQAAKKERVSHLYRTRGAFINMLPPDRLLDIRNAEINKNGHYLSLSPTIKPLGVLRGNYTLSWKYLAYSFGLYSVNNQLQLQDMHLKLRVLSSPKSVYHTALAIGVNQFMYGVSDFSFKNTGYSVFLSGDMSIPQFYSYASLYVDIRKLVIGVTYYPFFEQLQGKLSFIIQNELIFNSNYSNRFGDMILIEPGIRFAVIPNSFNMMISFEENEYVAFSFEFFF